MKTVVVMSGGGAKGCFQVGVLKYLEEQGVQPAAIYGTSVGALNACGFAYQGARGCEQIWHQVKDKGSILKFNWSSLILWARGFYNTSPLKKLIQQAIDGSQPRCEAVVCKTSLRTGEIAYGRSGDPDFADSVEASAAIPAIMDPIADEWVDGGVREMTPLAQVFYDHPDIERIIVILCNPFVKNPDGRWNKKFNWIKNAFRALDILEHEVFLNDIRVCLKKNNDPDYRRVKLELYCPDSVFMDTLEFDPLKIRRGIAQGYETAKSGPKSL